MFDLCVFSLCDIVFSEHFIVWRDVHLGCSLVLCVTRNVGVSECSLDGASLSSLKEGKGDVDVCGAKMWASVLDAREENKCSHV